MKRQDLINKIADLTFNYYMGFAMETVPNELVKWTKGLLKKLSDKDLVKEAKNCGIDIKVEDLIK